MDLNKPVSGRELARLTGQSEGAVRKARDRGSILKGIAPDGKYLPLIASNEWGKPILLEFLKPSVKPVEVKKPVVKKSQSVKPTPAPKKEKKEPETIEEFVAEIMHEKLPSADADDLDDETVSEELDDKIQKPEAERVTAVLKAKILQITYKEKQGQLIPRDKLAGILFGYGQEIRVACEGYVNTVLDPVRALENRHEAKRFMEEEMYKILNLLSELPNRKL